MDTKKVLSSPYLSSSHPFLFLITPSRKETLAEVISYFQKDKEKNEVYFYDIKQIQVELTLELQKVASSSGFKQKIIIVSFYSFLEIAQNRMLKTLEEVREGVRFIFITESKVGVLPTIISRAEVHTLGMNEEKKHFDVFLFLSTAPAFRMELPFVKTMLAKKDSDDKKDREYFIHFLSELLEDLPNTKEGLEGKKEVLTFLSFARDTSGAPKMILDYLALFLPLVVK